VLEKDRKDQVDCVKNEEVLQGIKEETSYIQGNEERLTGLVTSCIGIAF
jgi:hypothetical protein